MHRNSYYRYYTEDFGVIRDSLPAGNYYIEIMATGRGGPYKFFDAENRETAYIGPDWDQIPGVTNPEVYHKFLELKVREDTYLDMVELERVTGTIAVRLTDAAIPDSLSLWASATSVNGIYFADFPDQSEYLYEEFILKEDDFGNPVDRRKFDLIIFPYKKYQSNTLMSTVTIRASGPGGKTIASKIIEDVEVRPNWKIILKGALLTGGNAPTSQEFRIVADSIYTEVKTIEF